MAASTVGAGVDGAATDAAGCTAGAALVRGITLTAVFSRGGRRRDSAGILAVSAGLVFDGSSVFSMDFSAGFSADADLLSRLFGNGFLENRPFRRCLLPARLPQVLRSTSTVTASTFLGVACDTAAAVRRTVPGLVAM